MLEDLAFANTAQDSQSQVAAVTDEEVAVLQQALGILQRMVATGSHPAVVQQYRQLAQRVVDDAIANEPSVLPAVMQQVKDTQQKAEEPEGQQENVPVNRK
uniref:Uncharacterized protein n=1 Tax=Tetradesmus obliquus TaxID=3088 RepID=A0A383W7A0_TETOB